MLKEQVVYSGLICYLEIMIYSISLSGGLDIYKSSPKFQRDCDILEILLCYKFPILDCFIPFHLLSPVYMFNHKLQERHPCSILRQPALQRAPYVAMENHLKPVVV